MCKLTKNFTIQGGLLDFQDSAGGFDTEGKFKDIKTPGNWYIQHNMNIPKNYRKIVTKIMIFRIEI